MGLDGVGLVGVVLVVGGLEELGGVLSGSELGGELGDDGGADGVLGGADGLVPSDGGVEPGGWGEWVSQRSSGSHRGAGGSLGELRVGPGRDSGLAGARVVSTGAACSRG